MADVTFADNGAPVAPQKGNSVNIVGHQGGADKNYDLDQFLSDFETDDLSEGVGASNLWFTNERVDDRVAALIQNGTGVEWTYVDASDTLTASIVDPSSLQETNRLIRVNEGVISNDDISSLHVTPIQLSETPAGTNELLIPIYLAMSVQGGAITTAQSLVFRYGTADAAIQSIDPLFLDEAPTSHYVVGVDTIPGETISPGEALYLTTGAQIVPTDQGAVIKWQMGYRVVDFDTIT